MSDIFFSYAAADEARVRQLAEALKAQGLDADPDRRVLPGQNPSVEMNRRLEAAKVVVVVWSAASQNNQSLRDEAGVADKDGKLMPVLIDAIATPIGFGQLHPANLAGWPGAEARDGLLALTQALCARLGREMPQKLKPLPFTLSAANSFGGFADVAAGEPDEQIASGRFLRSKRFWFYSAAIAAASGLLFFLSPLGGEDIGGSSAERFGVMLGNVLAAFLAVAGGQALIHLSRQWVGKRSTGYFSIEFLIIITIAALLAAATFSDPEQQRDSGGGVIGFLHQFNFTMLGALMVFTPILALVRGVMRLARGKPRHA
jgi:hypothetical protein